MLYLTFVFDIIKSCDQHICTQTLYCNSDLDIFTESESFKYLGQTWIWNKFHHKACIKVDIPDMLSLCDYCVIVTEISFSWWNKAEASSDCKLTLCSIQWESIKRRQCSAIAKGLQTPCSPSCRAQIWAGPVETRFVWDFFDVCVHPGHLQVKKPIHVNQMNIKYYLFTGIINRFSFRHVAACGWIYTEACPAAATRRTRGQFLPYRVQSSVCWSRPADPASLFAKVFRTLDSRNIRGGWRSAELVDTIYYVIH